MKANRLLGAALAVGLGLAAITGTTVAEAQKKPSKTAPAQPTEAPTSKKPIVLFPKGIAWGMTTKQAAVVIDKVLDEAYAPRLKKVSSGSKEQSRLENEIGEKKSEFRRSRIDFGSIPTGIDSSPLKGEYTYNNKESLMTFELEGKKTHFFFIQDKLWKIIDERTLGEGNPNGKDYQDVVTKLSANFGVPGRVLAADYDLGRNNTEVDWKDASTHLRVIQRSDTAVAVALEDNVTLGNLATLRANKPADDNALDPAVASVTRKNDPEAPPPPAKDDKNKKKK